jgi:hypothetical protein
VILEALICDSLERHHAATHTEIFPCPAETDPPNRLVYLLDHEYTARGLSWSRLKGTDASRASLLRAAAARSGCEAVLALADIQETWNTYESEPEYGYRYDDFDDEEDRDDEGTARRPDWQMRFWPASEVRLDVVTVLAEPSCDCGRKPR